MFLYSILCKNFKGMGLISATQCKEHNLKLIMYKGLITSAD